MVVQNEGPILHLDCASIPLSSVPSPANPSHEPVWSLGEPITLGTDTLLGMGSAGSDNGSACHPPTPEELWPAYYEELHSVASALVRGEPRSPSLQPTLVLHEAFMKVCGGHVPQWRGKAYFVASIARAMRQYLIDRARRRRVERKALHSPQIRDVAELALSRVGRCPERAEELAIAIDALTKVHPRAAAVIELRCAYDFSNQELALLLGIAERTVKADWTFGRTWLAAKLNGTPQST